MLWEDVERHYLRDDVAGEIARFSRDRWVAIHVSDVGGLRMLRYHPSGGEPIRVESVDDLRRVVQALRPRSFYATIHRYRWRGGAMVDILSSMPSWDIDSRDGDWVKVVKAGGEILDELESHGVSRSVIVKWSGEGMHIHLNDKAFTPRLAARYGPLNIAYAVTQYIISRVRPAEGVLVENKVDPARVFTSPLSLHRSLDRVCVCIEPEMLDEFSPSWTLPGSFRHFSGWDRYVAGEADMLALKALEAVGPYPSSKSRRRLHPPVDHVIRMLHKRLGDI